MLTDNSTQKSLDENKEVKTPEQIESSKVKNIIQALIKSYSALKIYPIENPAVINSTMVFSEKLLDFLSEYGEIKIGIHEFSLTFNQEIIHTDGEKKKSLPFLFYKDGMRELSFHDGMDLEEIGEFLETVKINANLSEDECDIINSLWEKDFAHIRYFALDDFLDKNIGGGNNSADDLIPDGEKLLEGKIKLTQEDKDDIKKRMDIFSVDPGNDFTEGQNTTLSKEKKVSEAATISKKDFPEIHKLVADDRESSPIRELITFLFEVLFLEDRKDQFLETLRVLELCLQDTIKKDNFSQALLILNQIFDLKDSVPEQAKDKLLLLDRIIKKIKDATALQDLEKRFNNGKVENLDSFLEYIYLLSPESIPLTIGFWENAEDVSVKNRISLLLQKIGEKHIDTLVKFAQNGQALLAREIITILGKINKNHSLPFLKIFAHHKDKSIRMETIQALKIIRDNDGEETLLDLLSDKEEQIRLAAATSLNPFDNSSALIRIGEIIAKKDFDKKSRVEKRVFLNYCAQNPNEEIFLLFHSILKDSGFFLSQKSLITKLCVVAALETMATPEAVTILKEGSHMKKKRIKKACKFALRKLASRHSQYREIEVI
ncbi:MAG: HEAT repeat domain-containing protein [Candidatus Aminicenantes bacterium]|nr:HEAT repeat domain-containing protein [Candidatus Aminicenantes bacterium]